MSFDLTDSPAPLRVLPDGTVKQLNPFSLTEVWTSPGRANRPFSHPVTDTVELTEEDKHSRCAFCAKRKRETPPEKARILDNGEILRNLPISEYDATEPLFRRVSNLFEILPFSYWQANHDHQLSPQIAQRMDAYLADREGIEHVRSIVHTKRKAAGLDDVLSDQLADAAAGFFGGGHDLIISGRHYRPGAQHTDQLQSSGTMTVDEHEQFIRLTVAAMEDLYATVPAANYVVAFQNWLKDAGASFEHLHKQLVAVDELGQATERERALLAEHPNMYNDWALNYARKHDLLVAENDYAVAFAGFGHRYPTLEVFAVEPGRPFEHSPQSLRGVSDIVHAIHAAVGDRVACNEEWHHQPQGEELAEPWRIMIKLRVSTLAGFEGGTKIYINTTSPWQLRDRVRAGLIQQREQGHLADGIRIGEECRIADNGLRYQEAN